MTNHADYCYHALLKLYGLAASRRRIQQVATRYEAIGLHYSPQQDSLSLLCYRSRYDAEVLQALNDLAQVLPGEVCFRIEATCSNQEQDFGFLLYAGSIYRLDKLAQPSKPRRLVVGQRIAA